MPVLTQNFIIKAQTSMPQRSVRISVDLLKLLFHDDDDDDDDDEDDDDTDKTAYILFPLS